MKGKMVLILWYCAQKGCNSM